MARTPISPIGPIRPMPQARAAGSEEWDVWDLCDAWDSWDGGAKEQLLLYVFAPSVQSPTGELRPPSPTGGTLMELHEVKTLVSKPYANELLTGIRAGPGLGVPWEQEGRGTRHEVRRAGSPPARLAGCGHPPPLLRPHTGEALIFAAPPSCLLPFSFSTPFAALCGLLFNQPPSIPCFPSNPRS